MGNPYWLPHSLQCSEFCFLMALSAQPFPFHSMVLPCRSLEPSAGGHFPLCIEENWDPGRTGAGHLLSVFILDVVCLAPGPGSWNSLAGQEPIPEGKTAASRPLQFQTIVESGTWPELSTPGGQQLAQSPACGNRCPGKV